METAKPECPTLGIMHTLGKRWTVPVIEAVYFSKENASFNVIKRNLRSITARNLSETLGDLCSESLMSRHRVRRGSTVYVEYRLTRKGRELERLIEGMKRLGICWYGINKSCTSTACGTCPAFKGSAK